MNSYQLSNGERISQQALEQKIREAKQIKKDRLLDQYGYFFCEESNCNTNQGPLDMSHNISVQECKMSGRTELAFSPDNLTLRCRNCHNIYDNRQIKK